MTVLGPWLSDGAGASAGLINFQSSPRPAPSLFFPAARTDHPHLHPVTLSINNMPIKRVPAHARLCFALKSQDKYSSRRARGLFAASYIMDQTILLMNASFPQSHEKEFHKYGDTGEYGKYHTGRYGDIHGASVTAHYD